MEQQSTDRTLSLPDRNGSPTTQTLRPAIFYSVVLIVFLADQFSKRWVQQHMIPDAGSRPIIGQAFLLTLTHNTGGAWGLLPHGNGVFIVFACLAVIALLCAYHWMRRTDLLVSAAFALALGGALGNLLDRLRFGFVVDFFEARIIHWPIFNIADSAITIGILLLLLHFFRSGREEAQEAQQAPNGALATDDALRTPRE